MNPSDVRGHQGGISGVWVRVELGVRNRAKCATTVVEEIAIVNNGPIGVYDGLFLQLR
jgi:hypothetical protein